MKKFLALTCVLALAFSTTVCAAETVVPAKDFPILDKLAEEVDKSPSGVHIQCSMRDGWC